MSRPLPFGLRLEKPCGPRVDWNSLDCRTSDLPYVGIDVCSHDDFIVCGEFAGEGVEGVKEASMDVVCAGFGARMVDGRKCESKVFTSFLSKNMFPHSVIAAEDDVDADVSACEFTRRVSC